MTLEKMRTLTRLLEAAEANLLAVVSTMPANGPYHTRVNSARFAVQAALSTVGAPLVHDPLAMHPAAGLTASGEER